MTRDWESAFSFWARPPSKTEEQRSENVIRAIRKAVQGSSKLNQRSIKVFTQGSYRNRVNVRQDSDVDVGVMLYDFFLDEYPAGRTRADFGISDAGYSFSQFKNELEAALVDHFGRAVVKRGNKAFNIRENTYHVEADVVPLFEFRQYWESGNYRAGVALATDQGRRGLRIIRSAWSNPGLQRLCTTRMETPRTRPPAAAIEDSCAFSRRFATRWKTPAPHQQMRFQATCWNV